jgi:hypothetical protein
VAWPFVAPGEEPPTPGAPAAPSAPPFTPAPSPPFTPPPDVRDANADRVVLLPTAYTHPAGTVTVSTYDIVLLQAGYSVTDTTQVTLTSSIPIEGVVFADLSLKSVVARDGPVRVAAIGSATGVWGFDVGNSVLGRVGGVAEMCFDDGCQSSASFAATVVLGGPDTVAMTGVGVVWRVAPGLALLGEIDDVIPMTLVAGQIHGIGFASGIRSPHRAWSLDVALATPLGTSSPVAIPFVAFTLRFLP